jgi:hypothetical protein
MQVHTRAFAALLFASVIAAPAIADEATFYRGTHICNGNRSLDDWALEPSAARLRVFYRRIDGTSFETLELTASSAGDEVILSDPRGRPWVAARIASDGGQLQGRWLTYQGRPQSECEPFTLERTTSAKARMDELFTLLGTADPTVETARKVAAEQQRLPPIALLPELDQQSDRQRYAESAPAFWKRFYEAEQKRLAEGPIATPADRKRIVAAMRAATSVEVTPHASLDRDGAAREAALGFLRTVADRLATGDRSLEALPADGLCERLAGFSYIDTDRLELAVGLPAEYWDRAFAEDLIRKAQACRDGRAVVQLLTQSYPEIERRRKMATWLREQRDRLLALPLSLASFRESSGLSLSQEELRRNDVTRAAYERFIGASLEPRRAAMEEAAAREIRASFAGESSTSLPPGQARARCEPWVGRQWGNDALARLYKTCTNAADAYVEGAIRRSFQTQLERIEAAPKTFEGLRTHHWFQMETGDLGGVYPPAALSAEFNGKVAAARAEAARTAKGEVERAFASADALAETPDAPILQCGRDLPTSDETLRPLVQACREGSQAFAARREEARCKQALAASGAGDGLSAGTIRASASAQTGVPVRKLVCGGARQRVSVTFPTSGMLWWSKQYMEIRLPEEPRHTESGTIRWLMEPVGGSKSDWALARIESKTIELPAPQDMMLSCLAQHGFCR